MVCVSGHGWWQTRESLPGPPIQFSHTTSVADLNSPRHMHNRHTVHTQVETMEKEREQIRRFSTFLWGYDPLLSLFPLSFYVMSPCKKVFMVFPGLMAECGEVGCGSIPPGPELSVCDIEALPGSFNWQTGNFFPSLDHYKLREWQIQRTITFCTRLHGVCFTVVLCPSDVKGTCYYWMPALQSYVFPNSSHSFL